jgi:putative tricarboxylic transport membrane protein
MMERVVAVALLAAVGVYLASAWLLPRGTVERPGPGFYPMAVGVFGVAVALTWVLSTLRRSREPAGAEAPGGDDAAATGTAPPPDHGARRRVLATAGLLVAFCLALPWIGYPVAAFAFVGLALRGMGARWSPALVIGLVSAAGSYYVFGVLLGVPLPGGTLLD